MLAHLGKPLVDVRSPGEYTGELLHMPDYPQEGALRGGHIPGAKSVPWARAADRGRHVQVAARSSRRSTSASRASTPDDDVVAYCRIGERSSHTWFVLTHLLGFEHGAQLRRLVDRVGQRRARADREVTRDARPPCPPALAEIAEDFLATSTASSCSCCWSSVTSCRGCPSGTPVTLELLEQVDECQSPLFLAVEVDDGASPDERCHLFFHAPAEAPTTRGFAGILHEGLDGLTAAEVLAVPDDAPYRFGLARGRVAPAAARHGGDAGPDQAPGPRQDRRLSHVPDRALRHCCTPRSTDVATQTQPSPSPTSLLHPTQH